MNIPTGADLPSVALALVAGLLSFLSPCVLPLIPIYLSFISGEGAASLKSGHAPRGAIFARTVFFVFGFTLVFVLLALIFGGGMRFFGSSVGLWINRAAGLIVIVLGVNTLFDFIPFLRVEKRVHISASEATTQGSVKTAGPLRATLLGMAFAAGWTPCIGPMLSSILLFAGQGGNAPRAVLLLTAYSAGLGIPFLLAGLFLSQALPVLGWFKKHMFAVKITSGLLLIFFGILMLTDGLALLTILTLKAGYGLQELSVTGPDWIRPIAAVLARWLTFQGL